MFYNVYASIDKLMNTFGEFTSNEVLNVPSCHYAVISKLGCERQCMHWLGITAHSL